MFNNKNYIERKERPALEVTALQLGKILLLTLDDMKLISLKDSAMIRPPELRSLSVDADVNSASLVGDEILRKVLTCIK